MDGPTAEAVSLALPRTREPWLGQQNTVFTHFLSPHTAFGFRSSPPGPPLNLGQALILPSLPGRGQYAHKIAPAAPEGSSGPRPAPGLAFLETHPKDQGQRNWSPKVPSSSEI